MYLVFIFNIFIILYKTLTILGTDNNKNCEIGGTFPPEWDIPGTIDTELDRMICLGTGLEIFKYVISDPYNEELLGATRKFADKFYFNLLKSF